MDTFFDEPFEIKRGDRRSSFSVVLYQDVDEVPSIVDLSGASAAVFNMRNHRTQTIVVNRGSASMPTPRTAGSVVYDWGSADVATAGIYDAEIEVLWGDGKPETFPSGPGGGRFWRVLITEDIA